MRTVFILAMGTLQVTPLAVQAGTDPIFHPEKDIRLAAIQMIGRMGDKAKIPLLLTALSKERTPSNRSAILNSLVDIDSADPRVYTAVLASLADTGEDFATCVSCDAVFLLWDKFGDRPVRDLTTIIDNKKDSSFFRCNAACALRGVLNHVKGKIPKYVIDCIEANLFDKNKLVRLHVAGVVRIIANKRPEQTPMTTMVKAFTTDEYIRGNMANAFITCGKVVFPYMKKTIRHEDEDIRLATLDILEFIGNDSRALLPELRACFTDPSEKVRDRAKQVISTLTKE
jgi:HEAT repeat protein